MTRTERAIVFGCGGATLVGVLSMPPSPRGIGVVIIVGGPQYRAGSHRQFVRLARALADAGHPVLRFDHRGMGDSEGDPRSFEALDEDVGMAIAALRREVSAVQRVVLWGLCDGASAALMYWQATRDPALAGMCLANPWIRSDTSQARMQVRHYYTQRLRERAFWAKLLSGEVAWSAIAGLARSLRVAARREQVRERRPAYQQRMAEAWQTFGGTILLALSGRDYVAKEFLDMVAADPAWHGALHRQNVRRLDLPDADHTFSDVGQAGRVEALTLEWLDRLDQEAALSLDSEHAKQVVTAAGTAAVSTWSN